MKKHLTFLFLSSFFLTGYGQNETPSIYFGLQLSPNFSYRVLSNNSGQASVDDEIGFLNNNQEAAFGFRIAAVGGFKISKNWTLEAGITYVENCNVLNLNIGDQVDPRRGFIFDESIESANLKTCLSYVGIPIRIIWNFGTENTRILASFGLAPQILLDQRTLARTHYTNEDKETQEIENLEEAAGFNLSPSLGIGAEFKLSEKFFLRAEGIARFGVVNVNEDSPINSYIYSSELNAGIYYNLIQKSQSHL
ncbi:MAG: hypothetical protein ACJAQ4_002719 [Cryomorphaceae bacterium]|jgi:hypothetical protein